MPIGAAGDLDPAFDPRYGADLVTYLPKGGAAIERVAALLSAPERFERSETIAREAQRWVAEILVAQVPTAAKDDQILVEATGQRFTVNKVDQDGERYAWRLELVKQ